MAFDGRSNETLSQINVTPLVDVMLVLLVIFMVTAPILQQGVSVNLPQVRTGSLSGESVQLVVTVAVDGSVYLNDVSLPTTELPDKLKAVLRERPDRQVYLRADTDVPYGRVMSVMASIREAGVERLGMVTAPPDQKG
jgi:biopolymer transport protein TolR